MMADPARDPIQTLRDAMKELAQALGHTDADVIEARAALSRLEALRDAARAFEADLSDYCDGPLRDALLAALAACDNETRET